MAIASRNGMRLGNLKWQSKRNRMIRHINELALANNHLLHPWTKGRRFHTHCSKCGAVIVIVVSKSEQQGLEKLALPCI